MSINRANLILGALLITILGGCISHQYVEDNTYSRLYDFEDVLLHPDYLIYHSSDDTSEVHFSIDPSEILFARTDAESPFRSSVLIAWELLENENDSLHRIESGQTKVEQPVDDDTEGLLYAVIPFRCTDGSDYILQIDLKDLNRKTSASSIVQVRKTSKFTPQNFLPVTNKMPLWGYQSLEGGTVEIYCNRCQGETANVYKVTNDSKLPPPPFSSSKRFDFNHREGMKMSISKTSNSFQLSLSPGVYFISQHPEEEKGLTLKVRDSYFPEIMAVDDMTETVRYITSRAEYESIQTSTNPRGQVEKFWIDCAGSKDKARDLIRVYYSRVKEANYYFSHVDPGWKTDRGLIHIVFGNPKKIFKYPDREVWLYGEEDNLNSLQFTFSKLESPYSGNIFLLKRDQTYKTDWERAVTSWRNGRVYSE